jgi:hypothetical protein
MAWQQVIENWWSTHTLPPAAQIGLPAASSDSGVQ